MGDISKFAVTRRPATSTFRLTVIRWPCGGAAGSISWVQVRQNPLTLYGGSGTDNQDFSEAIEAGIAMIHINTELRVAWRRGLEESLREEAGSVAPYKVLPDVVRSVKAVVIEWLRLFNGQL
jgi:fructose/tagatose bisphosphate aldolase